MGQRTRRQGITGAALRAARAAARERDEQASDIAQAVYNTARELKLAEDADPLPLLILAPLMVAAERSAPGAAQLAGLNRHDPALVLDVAAYLVAGFREMVVNLNDGHFEQWRRETDRLSSAPTTTPEEESDNDGSDDGSGADSADTQPSAADGRTEDGE